MTEIPEPLRGWWRIVETSQWVHDGLDILGPALISLTGYADRLGRQRPSGGRTGCTGFGPGSALS